MITAPEKTSGWVGTPSGWGRASRDASRTLPTRRRGSCELYGVFFGEDGDRPMLEASRVGVIQWRGEGGGGHQEAARYDKIALAGDGHGELSLRLNVIRVLELQLLTGEGDDGRGRPRWLGRYGVGVAKWIIGMHGGLEVREGT
jgi:hypothetical protein